MDMVRPQNPARISWALRCCCLGGARFIRDLGQDDGRQRARPGKSVDREVGLVHLANRLGFMVYLQLDYKPILVMYYIRSRGTPPCISW